MNKEQLTVKVTYTEPVLATSSGNSELHAEYQASKSKDAIKMEEEKSTLPAEDVIEKTSTVFHRDENGLFIYDYLWRGFLKESIGVLCELGELSKITKWTYKRVCDSCIFITPRRVYFSFEGHPIHKAHDTLQRPLRATTMQGDRVALARSECILPGATNEFQITLLKSNNTKSNFSELNMDVIRKCLDMGQLKGQGQWRSGGYGRFEWQEVKS